MRKCCFEVTAYIFDDVFANFHISKSLPPCLNLCWQWANIELAAIFFLPPSVQVTPKLNIYIAKFWSNFLRLQKMTPLRFFEVSISKLDALSNKSSLQKIQKPVSILEPIFFVKYGSIFEFTCVIFTVKVLRNRAREWTFPTTLLCVNHLN